MMICVGLVGEKLKVHGGSEAEGMQESTEKEPPTVAQYHHPIPYLVDLRTTISAHGGYI